MGYDGKYGKVTTEYGDIPDDEPVIVFRARDRLTLRLIQHYADLCDIAGSPARHISLVRDTFRRFADWQEKNPDKIRVPASARSREWMGDKLSVR